MHVLMCIYRHTNMHTVMYYSRLNVFASKKSKLHNTIKNTEDYKHKKSLHNDY